MTKDKLRGLKHVIEPNILNLLICQAQFITFHPFVLKIYWQLTPLCKLGSYLTNTERIVWIYLKSKRSQRSPPLYSSKTKKIFNI